MKRFRIFIMLPIFFVMGAFSLFAYPKMEPAKRERGRTYELVMLHTNDHHGTVLPNDGRAGLAERAAFIKSARAVSRNVLLVDAGDINTGTALSNMFAAEADIMAYNKIGYDAVTFGNHEFDGTRAKLDKQIAQAQFPWVSSNIKTKDGSFLGGRQYLVKNYDGFRVGIIGLTTLRTLDMAGHENALINGLTFIPEIKAALDTVDILRNQESVDIVIALSHLGDVPESPVHVTSSILAASVPGIDIIVDAHSHTKYEEPVKVGNTWIVSANEWGKYVGQAKLSIVDGKLSRFDWQPVEINSKDNIRYAPDAEIAALIAPYKAKADASLKEVVGQAADEFILGNRLPRYEETALGNLITDANVWYFKTVYNQNIDFAFQNGGNIRASLPKGPVTQEAVLTVMPFENYLYLVSLKGSELLELFNFIASIPQGNGGFPQFSKEVRYTIDKSAGQDRGVIKDLTVGRAAVDPNRTYRFCTNDFILSGGDGYSVMKLAQDRFNSSLLLSFVVCEYIKDRKTVSPSTDGRLTVIGGATP